jgi:hypothetical protein
MSENIVDIRKWTAASKCPSCKGKLRKQGEVEQSSLEDLVEAGRILLRFAGFLTLVGYVKQAALIWVKAIRAGLKASSVLRQCKSCGEFATKCPKCKRIIPTGSKPGVDGDIHTTCPHCTLKITAWLITAEEVEKEEKRQREVKENTFFDYDWD